MLANLDRAVQKYCTLGIAPSTRRTYRAASGRFHRFCVDFNVSSPFPVVESTLCYFAAFLAQEGLAPSSIKVYLAAVRHMQVLMGLPEPRASSSLPRLKLVLNGIARARAAAGLPQKPRLPVTVHTLTKLQTVMAGRPPSQNSAMLWAACTLCFFGFFRAGEITIPSKAAYSRDRHLS